MFHQNGWSDASHAAGKYGPFTSAAASAIASESTSTNTVHAPPSTTHSSYATPWTTTWKSKATNVDGHECT